MMNSDYKSYLKYKFQDEKIPKDSRGYSVYQAQSESTKDSKKTKNWVAKLYEGGSPSVYKTSGEHHDFLQDAILDSFLTGILHMSNPLSPKGKIVDGSLYISRLYNLDGKKNVDVMGHDLRDLLSKKGSKGDYRGLLKSIVQRIVLEDWDSKLSNYSDTKAPFDLSYSLGSLGSEGIEKSWSENEISDLMSSKFKKKKARGEVAKKLTETIGNLGKRTNSYYYGLKKENGGITEEECGKWSKILTKSLSKELKKINKKDPGAALISVFKEVISEIEQHKKEAAEKVFSNINKHIFRVPNKLESVGILLKSKKELDTRLLKFRGFIENIEGNLGKGKGKGKERVITTQPVDWCSIAPISDKNSVYSERSNGSRLPR